MFDPYRKWLGILPKDQPPNHYRLLSVDLFESDLDVIEGAADRAMGFIRQYQSGENADDAARILNELATARLCLMKPEKRDAYDKVLRKQLSEAASSTGAEQDFAALPLSPADLKPIGILTNRKKKSTKSKSVTRTPIIIGSAAVACLALYLILSNNRPMQVVEKPVEPRSSSESAQASKAAGTRTVESSPPSQTVAAKSSEILARQNIQTISAPNDVSPSQSAEANSVVSTSDSPNPPDAQPVMKTEPTSGARTEASMIQPVLLRSWRADLGLSPSDIFSQDGSQIVYGTGNDVVVVKTETGENVAKLTGNKKGIWVARFCSNDRRVVSLGGDDSLRVWDLTTQKVLVVIKGKNTDRTSVLRATSDAAKIVFSTANDRRLVGIDGVTKTELGRIELTEPEVTWKAVTSDLKWGISNGIRNQTTFWNLDTRESFPIDNGHHNYCGYFTQDETHALLGGAYQWEIWDTVTRNKTVEGSVTGGHVYALAIAQKMNRVLAGLSDGTIWVFDMTTGQKIVSFKAHDLAIGMIVISRDEKYMMSQDHHSIVNLWRLSR